MLYAIFLLGCGEPCDHELVDPTLGSSDVVFDGYDAMVCRPDEAQYDAIVGPMVDEHCGACHGDTPAFGAPYSLASYDDLLAGTPRRVDRVARAVNGRFMPPSSSGQLDHTIRDTLVEWATCGLVHPDHAGGLEVDAPVYTAPSADNTGLPSFDLVAPGFSVTTDMLDRYQCFAFDAPVEAERFIKRMEVVLDESRVLHHVVLASDPQRLTAGQDTFECVDFPLLETPFLYTWAPGTEPFDFEDGGLRVAPNDRLVVQIHYNNGAGVPNVQDRSGIRIHHSEPMGTEWTMLDPGPVGFEVAEGLSAVCDTSVVSEPMRLLAGMPHMHEMGAEFHQEVRRRDGSVEPIVNLTGWDFETQRFYRYDMQLERGDELHTWCGFQNNTGEPQSYGERTQDEMCYHFIYVAAGE